MGIRRKTPGKNLEIVEFTGILGSWGWNLGNSRWYSWCFLSGIPGELGRGFCRDGDFLSADVSCKFEQQQAAAAAVTPFGFAKAWLVCSWQGTAGRAGEFCSSRH